MEVKRLVSVLFILSLFTSNELNAQEKNESLYCVRIYIGGYGVFEAETENDEVFVVRRSEVLRDGKKVSTVGELLENGFVERRRDGNRNAQLSRQILELQMLAVIPGGIRSSTDSPLDFQFAQRPDTKISESLISDVSIKDKNGNILFCGYIGSLVSEIRISGNKVFFVSAGEPVASFNSLVECAKFVNSELNEANIETELKPIVKPSLKPLPEWVAHSQFSRFASRVVLRDEKDEVCWWLAECEFRGIVTHHLLRMKSASRNDGE